MATGSRTETAAVSLREKSGMMRLPGDRGVWGRADRDLEPVTMVRKVNPYADIPSLYDMYVQAASRDRRPGTLWHGDFSQRDAQIRMPSRWICQSAPTTWLDRAMAWQSISGAAFLRDWFDRWIGRGRINLPEAGPLLVSGRTLGEVQESVQQVLRTQFRDDLGGCLPVASANHSCLRRGRSCRAGSVRHQFAFHP